MEALGILFSGLAVACIVGVWFLGRSCGKRGNESAAQDPPTIDELDEALRTLPNPPVSSYDSRTARALRITGGSIPEASSGIGRITRWGKNHHLDKRRSRTLCGLVTARKLKPVDWGYGWCVQCDDVLHAMNELNRAEVSK